MRWRKLGIRFPPARNRARPKDKGCWPGSACKPEDSTRLLQLFGPEDFVIDVLLENSKIDIVRASQLRSVDGVQPVAKFLLRREVLRSRLRRVVGQLAIETMVTELSRLLRIGLQILFDVIVRNFFGKRRLAKSRMCLKPTTIKRPPPR